LIFSHHNQRGCPTRSGFRRVGTTNLEPTFMDHIESLSSVVQISNA